MLNWFLTLCGLRRERSETRCPKTTVKPRLESLEGRDLPSVLTVQAPQNSQAVVASASPPALPPDAGVTAQVVSMVNQGIHVLAAFQSDVRSAEQIIAQEILMGAV